MIHAFFLQIRCQFISSLEISSVLAVVIHIRWHLHRVFHFLVAPAVRGGDVAQVAKSVAVVLAVVIVEIALKRGYLLGGEIAVFHEVAGAQGFGKDGNAILCCRSSFYGYTGLVSQALHQVLRCGGPH